MSPTPSRFVGRLCRVADKLRISLGRQHALDLPQFDILCRFFMINRDPDPQLTIVAVSKLAFRVVLISRKLETSHSLRMLN
jgi:hypothetical protein